MASLIPSASASVPLSPAAVSATSDINETKALAPSVAVDDPELKMLEGQHHSRTMMLIMSIIMNLYIGKDFVLVTGLQGGGKTTRAAKFITKWTEEKKSVLVIPPLDFMRNGGYYDLATAVLTLSSIAAGY